MNNPSPTKKRRQGHTTDQRAAKQLPADAPAWLPNLMKWEQAKYDGIKGSPPNWLPEPARKQFYSARALLFFLVEEKKATYAEIRFRFEYLAQNKYEAIVSALLRDAKPYDDDLLRLVTLYQASSLKPEEGLRRLAGETAVAGFRARTGYQKREEFLDRPEVQRIARAQWTTSPNATIIDIINSPALAIYRRRYKGKHTLRKWLSAVDPRSPKAKRGRPRITK